VSSPTMAVVSKQTTQRWDEGRTDRSFLSFVVTCWIYCVPGEEELAAEYIVHYLTAREIRYSHWKASLCRLPQHVHEVSGEKSFGGKAFAGVKVLLTTTRGDIITEAGCHKHMENLCRVLSATISHEGACPKLCRNCVGIRKEIIAWSIVPSGGYSSKLAKFELTSRYRTTYNESPAGQIEHIMNGLLGISDEGAWRRDLSHEGCSHHSILTCITSLVAQIKDASDRLANADSKLEIAVRNGSLPAVMEDFISTLVEMNQAGSSILYLIDRRILQGGLTSVISGRYSIFRLLKRIFDASIRRLPSTNDPKFSEFKAQARIDSHHYRCISQTVAAHVRLQSPSSLSSLASAVASAPTRAEKCALPSKIGLVPDLIGNKSMHSAALAKTCGRYREAAQAFVKDVERMVQVIDEKKKRRGASRKGWKACEYEKRRAQEKLKALEQGFGSDTESTVDSEEDWNEEKMEKWMV